MQRKMILSASLAALLGAATLAQAADERLATNGLDEVLSLASGFGFQTIEEIEVESRDRVEVEGWLDGEWQADVRFDLNSGETLKEERKRRDGGTRGLAAAEVRDAMAIAVTEGMAEFEAVQVERSGRVDIDGYDASGRELEVTIRDGQVIEVEHD